jgi:hypothetical protein
VRIFETGALITVGYLCGGLSGDAVEVLKMILGSRTP